MNYVLERLNEASTWQGLILLATSVFHFTLGAEISSTIVSAGVGLAGLVGALLPNKAGASKNAAN